METLTPEELAATRKSLSIHYDSLQRKLHRLPEGSTERKATDRDLTHCLGALQKAQRAEMEAA